LAPQVDPTKFMPKSKRDFITQLEVDNANYNQQKTDFLVNDLNYPDNDDVVDEKVLYADYDDYRYKNPNDD